jgi:hypothetical protein
MSDNDELVFRKRLILQRSALLREVLAVQVTRWLAPVVGLAHQARAGQRWVAEHPGAAAGAAVLVGAAVVACRPGRLWRLVPQALALWQVWQRIRLPQV